MAGLFNTIFNRGIISENELPDCLRQEVLQALPGTQFGEIRRRPSGKKRWREEYEAVVRVEGGAVGIDAEVDKENNSVYELEINFIDGSANRRLDSPNSVSIEGIPPNVLELSCSVVATMVSGFTPQECERGLCGGRTAFRIKGAAGDWKVKVKVVEDGPVLEMQKKRMSRHV